MAAATRHPLVSYQPIRLVFQLVYFASVIPRLPYYLAVSLVPALRPNPRWSFKQSFMTRLIYPLLDVTSRIGITEGLTLNQGKQGDRFCVVPPAPARFYQGVLASDTVKPATIGGTWFPSAPAAGQDMSSKTVVYYLHGGAFIQGDGRDELCGPIADKLLKKGGADAVFSLQYRLSGYGGRDPFPAALQDAVSGYFYLVNEMRIPARRIAVAGDSAGGNLATALLLYLSEHGTSIDLPQPRCAALISSWVAPFQYQMSDNPQRGTDFIPTTYPAWGAHAYAGHLLPGAETNPYITPLGNTFSTPVPILAHAGTSELFLQRIDKWAEDMRTVEGNVVELYHEEDGVHDTILSGGLLGFEESAWEVAAKIGEFVRKH